MRKKAGNVTIVSIHKLYNKEKAKIDAKLFKEICYSFNKKISDKIINHGKTIKLPYRLGELSVQKQKQNYDKLAFDYQEWKRTGAKVYLLNDHSDEYIAKFVWSKKHTIVKNKRFYSFNLVRDNKRAITKIMKTKQGHQIYQIKENVLKAKIN